MTDCQYSHGESLVVANDGTIYAIAQHGYKDSIISYKREADGSYEENEACAWNGLVCEIASGKGKLSFAAMKQMASARFMSIKMVLLQRKHHLMTHIQRLTSFQRQSICHS